VGRRLLSAQSRQRAPTGPAMRTLVYNMLERYPPMQCPVCTFFKRELNQECENEAVATLRQRARLTAPVAVNLCKIWKVRFS
jgi:hypothetical protein